MFRKKRFARHLEELVENGEEVVGSFDAFRGPQPGSEMVLVPLWLLVAIGTSSYVLMGISVWASVLAFDRLRTYVKVVRTDRNVIVVEDKKWPRNSSDRGLVLRLDTGAIAGLTSHMIPSVKIAQQNYRVAGANEDEARRLSKLTAPPEPD